MATQPVRPDGRLTVEVNYGTLCFYSADQPWAYDDEAGPAAMAHAVDAADAAGRAVAVVDGVAVLLSEVQSDFDSRMTVEVGEFAPPSDDEAWDQVEEISLPVATSGKLYFVGSGGRDAIECPIRLPAGLQRVRVSARGYARAAEGDNSEVEYRLWVFPCGENRAAEVRKRWEPGAR